MLLTQNLPNMTEFDKIFSNVFDTPNSLVNSIKNAILGSPQQVQNKVVAPILQKVDEEDGNSISNTLN